MRDRSYAVILVIILVVCCLGAYVAISGYLNSIPPALSGLLSPRATTPVATLVVIQLPTLTAVPKTVTVQSPPPIVSVPSPLGVFQTTQPFSTVVGTPGALPPPPGATLAVQPSSPIATTIPPARSPTASQACTTPFCPRTGPPDGTIGPGGQACPRNYIFGRVVDAAGNGLPDRIIAFIGPSNEHVTVRTKGMPDPPGVYNIPTMQPGNTYTLWLQDSGGSRLSPQVSIATQDYSGSGNCPNRLDFVQVR